MYPFEEDHLQRSRSYLVEPSSAPYTSPNRIGNSMRPLLQEAHFACFDDDDGVSQSSLPSFSIATPSSCSQPLKSFAHVRTVECTGSGTFYFQTERLRDRFVCWRVLQNVVVLREWSFNSALQHNGVRLEFATPVVSTGVFVVESWEADAVAIHLVTHAGTIHRFSYSIPKDPRSSIFAQAKLKAFPDPQPATRSRCDVIQTLQRDEVLTVAVWVNEYNLVVGTDTGHVVGVNFGLPRDLETMQECVFSDESIMRWLWQGIVRTTKATFQSQDSEKTHPGAAIVAVTCFPLEDEDDESTEQDVCVVTLSADCVLRAWSFGSQSCLGRQELRHLETKDWEPEATRWYEDEREDRSSRLEVYATQTKIVALSATESDNCRLLVHFDTTAAHSSAIYLLRGDVPTAAALSAGVAGESLALETARVFTLPSSELNEKRGFKMVDFAVDKSFLFSAWRSVDGDEVYVHSNPMALTGPKQIGGVRVSSYDVLMQKYAKEDRDWLFDLKEEGVLTIIDTFYVERILIPGRFSRQNLSNAIVEIQQEAGLGCTTFTLSSMDYKELLIRLVSSRLFKEAIVRTKADPCLVRIKIWKELIALCTKHWRCENVPIGFAITTNALLPGSPVLLRRNRVSLLFPSAASIATALPSEERRSSSIECVTEVTSDVLPIFDAFSSQSFQSLIHREVADVASAWKVESFVALARHCVRLGVHPSTAPGQDFSAEVVLTRSILQLSRLLGGEAAFHDQVFHDLVERLYPFALWRETEEMKPLASKWKQRAEDNERSRENSKTLEIVDAPSTSYLLTQDTYFAGPEMGVALDQVVSRTIDEMCSQSLRVVLFLSYLIETRPLFLTYATLSNIGRLHLPKAIIIYQRWRLSQWLTRQSMTESGKDSDACRTSSGTLMPTLLQSFFVTIYRKLYRSEHFKRALSVLQLASTRDSVRREAHDVLVTFARELVQFVAQPNDALARFLRERHHVRVLRAMLCCNLQALSLNCPKSGEDASLQQHDHVHYYVRSIGECLALEGQNAAAIAHDDAHARWCFQQSIRCFSICLSNALLERHVRVSRSEKTLEPFIYDFVGFLKESIPRGYYDQLLVFLWTVVTQALSHLAHEDGGEETFAVQSFIWVNVFKYSVEEQSYRDAHLALMHLVELTAALGGSDVAAEADETASECVNYLVKELYRCGHVDLICELQWGSLESHVEKYLLWQAANATVFPSDGLDANAMRYYHLLYTFYMRKQQPANAASSLYALALRLRLAASASKAAMEAQRNALNAACISLRSLSVANRWVVRKLHSEEILATADNSANPILNIVTLEDMRREVAILDGKLRLLALGHSDCMLLSTIDGDEVVALLIDAVYSSCHNIRSSTLAERRQLGLQLIEIAADIANRGSSACVSGLTKSLARYCVASEHSVVSSPSISRANRDLLWDFLEMLLKNMGSLAQYEIAADTVLEYWQQQGRKLALPLWLQERLMDATDGNPAKLLRLYLKHGLLIEGLQLVDHLLSVSMASTKSENAFQNQVENAKLQNLPYIPHNLVDEVLDSTAAVLKDVKGQVSPAAMKRLRKLDHHLRQQLMRYFCMVNALQQAQEASHLARSR
ncbi:hypothetical protein CCR75_005791 [Bremia lactucae]|uniref:Nuclear pore complex protein Nup160 n=1 Tax=Bremia lactucae TaxID=4779 RepID=A0A976FGT7_BRELC|nr:hypothetical protein CCR75_005791 [Bremia lactucae]